jgi:hypothetical protein
MNRIVDADIYLKIGSFYMKTAHTVLLITQANIRIYMQNGRNKAAFI